MKNAYDLKYQNYKHYLYKNGRFVAKSFFFYCIVSNLIQPDNNSKQILSRALNYYSLIVIASYVLIATSVAITIKFPIPGIVLLITGMACFIYGVLVIDRCDNILQGKYK